jgi:transposase
MGKARRGRRRGHAFPQRTSQDMSKRVQRVGPEHFGILAVDSSKRNFALLLSDYYGAILADMLEVKNTGPALAGLVVTLRALCERHGLHDLVVGIERTGRYHVPIRTVLREHWDVTMVHPFATKQLRQPVDGGNKTEPTDLRAITRAVQIGYGRHEPALPSRWAQWRLVNREREWLVGARASERTRTTQRLEALLPGYGAVFSKLWECPSALALARDYGSGDALRSAGEAALLEALRAQGLRPQQRTILKALQWAAQAAAPDPESETRHRLFCRQLERLDTLNAQIRALEGDLAEFLVDTPFILLLAIPGINVVSASGYGAELGPLEHYANARKITGRAGLFPSRYQSDEVDRADGPLVAGRNARLRDALLEIARNLLQSNAHFGAWASLPARKKWPHKRLLVAIANKFARVSYAMLTGPGIFDHPSLGRGQWVLRKLLAFAWGHGLAGDVIADLLHRAALQLPQALHESEAAGLLTRCPRVPRLTRRGAPTRIGVIVRDVLAELNLDVPFTTDKELVARPELKEDPCRV